MRSRETHREIKRTLSERKGTLDQGPSLHLQIITSQGRIDDVSLAFSREFCYTITSEDSDPKLEQQIITWLQIYSKGQAPDIVLPFNVSHLTPFTQKALSALQDVPFGQTATYSDIAKTIDHSKAVRAIGSACHHNPFPIFIPCHRILAKTTIGGFAYPLEVKKQLLKFESKY